MGLNNQICNNLISRILGIAVFLVLIGFLMQPVDGYVELGGTNISNNVCTVLKGS
ncbi:MAG: hypothetical protein ISR80_00610 [Nitrosopumilus sp.]|nr:hypothetical protein [Nitrosopumilus sp.]MDC4231555.1 hypothetical protein [Nitrosopumilus sp.]